MIRPMTYELGQGTGPLAGVKVVEIAGIGPGPHACMLLADLGADVTADRASRRAAAHRRVPRPVQPRPAQCGAGPEATRGRRDRAPAGRGRRRARRGHASRGHRADRDRPRGVPGPQPAAGLRPDDRLGTERAVGARRRPRHELHRDHRHLVRAGPGQGEAAVPDQPGRRLRRRVDLPGHRRPRRADRGAGQRAGPGRRRRDRRRHRQPQRDGRGLPGQRRRSRRSGRPTCSTAARRTTTSTRPPTAGTCPSARSGAAVLRGVRRPARHPRARPRPVRPRPGRGAARGHRREVQGADPGRVVGGLRRHRRLRRADPADERGRRTTRTSRRGARSWRRRVWCSRRRRRGSPAPRPPSATPRLPDPGRTPARRWPPGASTTWRR